MRIRNHTDTDVHIFKLHIAAGQVVEVPDLLEESKRAKLLRMFEEVSDVPPPVEPKPAPEPDPIPEVESPITVDPAEEPKPESPFMRGSKARRKKRSSKKD